MFKELLLDLYDAQNKVENTRNSLNTLSPYGSKKKRQNRSILASDIEIALRELSEPLALSYAQARADLDSDRITWVSIAHEIREVLRQMLDLMAPDAMVMQ